MKKNQKRGFTFVETLVAITVMLLVIIGPMTVAKKGIQTAYFATEQATAVFLAQEAVEAVREYRDDVALSVFDNEVGDTSNWHPSCAANSAGCLYDGTGLEYASSPGCGEYGCRLYIKDDDADFAGRYTHDESLASPSPFSRKIEIWPRGVGGQHAEVIVTVSWEAQVFGGDRKSIELKTWIYNHYQRYE